MSGPTTVVYESPVDVVAGATGLAAVILAARAIREAREMQAEYGAVYARVREREAHRFEQRQRLREANSQRVASIFRQAERLRAKLARLQAMLQEQAGTQAPMAEAVDTPAGQDEQACLEHLARLQAAVKRLELQLSEQAGMERQALDALLAEAPATHEVLTAYARQRARRERMAPEDAARFEALAQHLLSRLELAPGDAMPVRVESLAREMVLAHSVERAEVLASDLRLEIQRANERRSQQLRDAQDAALLLSQLADEIPQDLRATLEEVAAGARLLDAHTRAISAALSEEIKAARMREEQEAMAVVLEQSLRDLGYEVEGIAETLFVTGGVAHFRKPAWGNYYVRLRVNTSDSSVNFNVVRAQGSGDAAADRKLDYLAEDRWCAEFPSLLGTLQARGLKLAVTRQLQAGELPVQVVDASTLPAPKAVEERAAGAPRQRYLDGGNG